MTITAQPVPDDVAPSTDSQAPSATASEETTSSTPSSDASSTVDYTMYAVFREDHGVPRVGLTPAWKEISRALLAELEDLDGLVTRGWYDVSGFRADADLLIWWHAPSADVLQAAYRIVLDFTAGLLTPVWSNIGVHRTAEFNRAHVPAFLTGADPKGYLCVYPFVRGREWYLLPDEERSTMLREHGVAARDFGDVLANTVSSFGLGDYEWLLAFEADELVRIVDLMRTLRATDARRHVIEETPFFTGPRRAPIELLKRVFS